MTDTDGSLAEGASSGVRLRNTAGVAAKVYLMGDTEQARYLDIILDGETKIFDVDLGAILTFEAGDDHETIDAIRIDNLERTYDLEVLPVPLNRLPPSYHSISNLDPSLHSYDISQIDPFHLDREEAKKRPVFRRLEPTDRDYVVEDGGVYRPIGFQYSVLDTGWGEEQTSFHANSNSFRRKVFGGGGGGFQISGPGKTKVGGKVDVSYSSTTGSTTSEARAYGVTRMEIQKYRIRPTLSPLDDANPQLSSGFITSIVALPTPPDGPPPQDVVEAYRKFVVEWGTHFPTEMTFGGFYMGIRTMTRTQLDTISKKKLNIKADAKIPTGKAVTSIAARGGFEEITTSTELDEFSSSRYVYRGGEGGKDNWRVDDGAQPIGLALAPIADLLTPDLVPSQNVPTKMLAKKKSLLSSAIEQFLDGMPEWSTTTVKPTRTLTVEWFDLGIVSRQDAASRGTFGTISCTPSWQEGGSAVAFWDRTLDPGSRVNLDNGETYRGRYPNDFKGSRRSVKSYSFTCDQDGKYPLADKKVSLYAEVKGHVNVGDNFMFGKKSQDVTLADFPSPQTDVVLDLTTSRQVFLATIKNQARVTFRLTNDANEDFENMFEV